MKRGVITIGKNGTVSVSDVPVWMSVEEMADLFGVFGFYIRKAIQTVYKDGVIMEAGTKVCMNIDSRTNMDVYSLETVIAVSYKIKSANASLFRNYLESRILQEYKRSIMYLMLPECCRSENYN